MTDNKYFLTAAIPYVNGIPHIGHALEFVQCDAFIRFKKLTGMDTLYISGSDENGLKIVQAAEKNTLSPQELADKNTIIFQNFAKSLNVSIDVWRRGSDKKLHWPGTGKLWRLCKDNGDIYSKIYGGYYCVGCEDFYVQKDLIEGKCPEHLKEPEWVEEENYFFRLSKYQKQIEELITTDKLMIVPQAKKNEVLSFIRTGLEDFSISRSKKRAKNWGIPVPDDINQVIYTWYDGLNIYQTAVGFGYDDKLWQKWWPADVHVIGKGILRFHAVYWIGILLSAKLPLPKSIFAHGYLTVDGQKMSKTLGNVVDPLEMIKKYGIDPLRYYLLREIPSYGDGDFSERRFKEIYNADLANGLGNLVARVARLCESEIFTPAKKITLPEEYKDCLEIFKFDETLTHIWELVRKFNQYIDKEAPWKIENKKKLAIVLQKSVDGIREVAWQLQPFLPETAEKILSQFKGPKIISQPPLFPRLI